jgi:hypothetical protein
VRGYEFYFRSSDGGEPPHIHVKGNRGRAKLWLSARFGVADDRGYDRRRLGEIERITATHREDWLEAWSRFFKR